MYKLHFLINVFGVSPTFLLPIFKKENNYFFQEIENGTIKSFEKANLDQFKNCKRYYIKSLVYMVRENCSPIFGIETPDCNNYYIGKQTDILHYYKGNLDDYLRFPHFCNSVNRFEMIKLECSNKYELTMHTKKTCFSSDDFKKITIETFLPAESGNTIYEKNLFYKSYSIIKQHYLQLQKNIRKKKFDIIKSENKNILFNSDLCFECDNIFEIFEIVSNPKLFRRYPVIKSNTLLSKVPLSIQINVLSTLYSKKIFFTTNEVYNLYLRRTINNRFYLLDKIEIQNMLKNDWNLNINPNPNTIGLYKNIILDDEHKNSFYFGVKKISKKDYAIIAENIYSNELYVNFNDINLNNDDIINFIKNLYLKTNHTVNLTPCCDESKGKIFNDEFSKWLGLNEDICSIKGLQNFVSTHF